jgi:hypothetical protein
MLLVDVEIVYHIMQSLPQQDMTDKALHHCNQNLYLRYGIAVASVVDPPQPPSYNKNTIKVDLGQPPISLRT